MAPVLAATWIAALPVAERLDAGSNDRASRAARSILSSSAAMAFSMLLGRPFDGAMLVPAPPRRRSTGVRRRYKGELPWSSVRAVTAASVVRRMIWQMELIAIVLFHVVPQAPPKSWCEQQSVRTILIVPEKPYMK